MSTAEQLLEIQPLSPQREFDFLAPERRQKFDLLLHLLANLQRLILLSGPDGIGKTTFLHQLQADALPGWRVLLMEADGQLNLERLQQSLARALGLQEATEAALTDQLQRMGAANEVVVLALDEGGRLLPGVLDAIWRFAARHKALRMVVALRPDDLYVKGNTDRWAVEEAHVINIPPLSEDQTCSFIRSLWTRLGRQEPDEGLARTVYSHSHGIPARVRQAALDCIGRPPMRWHRAMARPVYIALGIVLSLVIGLTYWQQQRPVATKPETSGGRLREQVRIEPSPRRELDESRSLPSAEPALETGSIVAPASGEQVLEPVAGDSTAETRKSQGGVALEVHPAEAASTETGGPKPEGPEMVLEQLGIHDAQWLLQQDPLHFTWQIAAFDNPEELIQFARRYRQLQPLAYYRKQRQGQPWYSLLFGIYPAVKEARKAQAGLPAEIGRPWLRRLRSVQKDIRAVRVDSSFQGNTS